MDIEAILARLVKAETNSLLFNLKQKEDILNQQITAVNTLHESLRTLEAKIERTIDTVHTELQVLQTEIDAETKQAAEQINFDLTTHIQTLENRCTDNERKLDTR